MNKIHLFPTFVGRELFQGASAFKSKVFDTISDHLSDDGYSHELTGHLTLQHDVRYKQFFEFATMSAMQYVACLNIDPNIYDYNIVKSWFNITKERNNPRHAHSDAHISFVYYISTPIDVKKMLCFFIDESPNQLYSGMDFNIKEFCYENSLSWSIEVNEGEIYLFPASLAHGVISSKSDITLQGISNSTEKDIPILNIKEFRVAIAGDIILTHKDKALIPMGLQPTKNWRTF
jgi:hypothetical protein